MTKKVFLLVLLVGFFSTTTFAQISTFFKSEVDLTGWVGVQADMSFANNSLQLDVTGGFWALAKYAPEGGFTWDFDNERIICLQAKYIQGEILIGFYDGTAQNPEWKMKYGDKMPIEGKEDEFIKLYEFDAYPNNVGNLTGIFPLTELQVAVEYTNPGHTYNLRWIKSFKNLDEAYDFIAPILDGNDPPTSIKVNKVISNFISGQKNSISFNLENEEQISIFDITGRCVKQKIIQSGIIEMNKGIYIVKIGNNTTKVIVN
jgi:hypothetical protein